MDPRILSLQVNPDIATSGYVSESLLIPPVVNGTPGFVEGLYNISVYSLYYRHIQESMGRLDVEDM